MTRGGGEGGGDTLHVAARHGPFYVYSPPFFLLSFFSLRLDTARGNSIVCAFFRTVRPRFTLLFSHGNATDLGQMRDQLARLSSTLGVDVLAFDYSGYGRSSGSPSETNCYADINAAYVYLVGFCGLAPSDIILYGQSVGSGPTVDLVSFFFFLSVNLIYVSWAPHCRAYP